MKEEWNGKVKKLPFLLLLPPFPFDSAAMQKANEVRGGNGARRTCIPRIRAKIIQREERKTELQKRYLLSYKVQSMCEEEEEKSGGKMLFQLFLLLFSFSDLLSPCIQAPLEQKGEEEEAICWDCFSGGGRRKRSGEKRGKRRSFPGLLLFPKELFSRELKRYLAPKIRKVTSLAKISVFKCTFYLQPHFF